MNKFEVRNIVVETCANVLYPLIRDFQHEANDPHCPPVRKEQLRMVMGALELAQEKIHSMVTSEKLSGNNPSLAPTDLEIIQAFGNGNNGIVAGCRRVLEAFAAPSEGVKDGAASVEIMLTIPPSWLEPGGVVPVDAKTTQCLIDFIKGALAYNRRVTDEIESLRTASPADVRARVVESAVNKFLGWPLPKDFHPDCGISFSQPPAHALLPIGTNLFTAEQAKEMFRYCLADSLAPSPAAAPELTK